MINNARSKEIEQKINAFRSKIAREHRIILDFKIQITPMGMSESDKIMAERIIEATASVFGISIWELKGQRRYKNLVYARHCSRALIKKHTLMTLTQIGRFYFGKGKDSYKGYGTNHSTLLSSISTHNNLHDTDADYRDRVKKVLELLELTTPKG